jgi:hypothetical protein
MEGRWSEREGAEGVMERMVKGDYLMRFLAITFYTLKQQLINIGVSPENVLSL